MNEKIKVLVTGGAGFIGSNLCEHLIDQGYTVLALDNLATGHEHNLSAIKDHERFRFIHGDIRDLVTCREAVAGCDYVLHQAALGSVPQLFY